MNTLVPTARAGGGSALIAIEYQMDTPVYALQLIMRSLNERIIFMQLHRKRLSVSFQLRSHQRELFREFFLRL